MLTLPKLLCPRCGNALFDQGFSTLWCGACAAHVGREAAKPVCPKCERPVVSATVLLDTELECPAPRGRR